MDLYICMSTANIVCWMERHASEILSVKPRLWGQTAIAITDHGAMYGVVDFYNAAKKQGIKPILGFEAYVTADLHEKTSKNREYASFAAAGEKPAGDIRI